MIHEKLLVAELTRLRHRVEAGALTVEEGLERAAALGAEFERLEAMHTACAAYSQARAERERLALERPSSRPPP